MSKIFLVGEAPLPFTDSKKRTSGGLRTWQFLKPLQDANHQIISILFTRPDFWLDSKIPPSDSTTILIDREDQNWQKRTQKLLNKFNPDCLVAVGSLPSEKASQLNFSAPFWADLNGSPIMEGATQAMRLKSDDLLPFFWAREKAILDTADIFSTCSKKQADATFGILASLGRLNHLTFDHTFLHPIPNLTEHFPEIDTPSDSTPLIKNTITPKSATIISMVGGWWNSWLDETTLFKALELAMSDQPNLHFIAGGGAVPGLTLAPLDNFKSLISHSEFQDRFHLLGWVPTSDLAKIYSETDIVISTDLTCPDTFTGARNRLTEWSKFALPIITTKGTEIANQLIKNQCAVGAKIGDTKALADAIIWLAKDKTLREQIGKKAQEFCQTNWNFSQMQSLLDWVKNPILSPDHSHQLSMTPNFWNTKVKAGIKYTKENGLQKGFQKAKEHLKLK